MTKTVLIYRDWLLPISETFIAEQAHALQRYRPKFAGLGPVIPSLPFDEPPLCLRSDYSTPSAIARRLYTHLNTAPSFFRAAARESPALIHAHFAPDGAHAAALAAKLRIPLMVTLWGYDVTVHTDFARAYGRLWKEASLFLCCSDFLRRKALEAGFPEEKLRVHYVGVNPAKFMPIQSDRDPQSVLFVGRLVEKKGCEYLLRAMAIAQKQAPDSCLTVIGDGPLRQSLEALAKSLSIRCAFLGAQPYGEVQNWMRRASILCVPSVMASNGDCEGLPLALLEAQGMGLPIVGTEHAGIPEAVIHGSSGLLAPERDVDTLAQHLLRYLLDVDLQKAHGSFGAQRVREEFNIIKQTALLETFYDEVGR